MRENRTYGSEGGEAQTFPTPIKSSMQICTPTGGNRNSAKSGLIRADNQLA